MKSKISALIDGELPSEEAGPVLDALRADVEARDGWHSYHLIGDVMRDAHMLSGGFAARVAAKIEQEPTVLSPVPKAMPAGRTPAWSFALAAGLAVAFVGGTTFLVQRQQGVEAPVQVAQKAPPDKAEAARVAPPDKADEYLLAHQGYSPRNSLQGVAPYVRTVSGEARGPRR